MGTPSGINTRRYHGILVAATNPPAGRHVLLASLELEASSEATSAVGFSANQYPGTIFPQGYQYLQSFTVDDAATWVYKAGDIVLEKSLRLSSGANAATVELKNLGDSKIWLVVKPLVSHKFYHSNFHENSGYPQHLLLQPERTIIEHESIPLILTHEGANRIPVQGWYYRFEHEEEQKRGLEARDDLFCPCELHYALRPGEAVKLIASTSEVLRPRPLLPKRDATSLRESLIEAGEKFIVETNSRTSIIAGYPWFADWGRDTMISLPGILLHTGRVTEARKLLVDYASCIQDGLIPNRFGEAGGADYNTVDATLWFVNAVYKTLQLEWEQAFARLMLTSLETIFVAHMAGTRYGIHVDPEDCLLSQGAPGLQLTWMDAKIDDWVVTPRHGKPVEVNGLWINALRIMEWVAEKLSEGGEAYARVAAKAEEAFERRFWHESREHYADTVDPLDLSLRPNQVIAMSLPFAPAKGDLARRALLKVEEKLLTPCGLRTLAPDEPGYCGRFEGKLYDLDAAYHRGTVWPWLMGPFVTAIVKLTGDREKGLQLLQHGKKMLEEKGMGGISEVYDGDAPQRAGGCPWQAWSVAEYLRALSEDVQPDEA